MLLFLILFFYEKNQCQSTDPLRNQAGRAEPAAPLSTQRLSGEGQPCWVFRTEWGQACAAPSPSHKRVHLTLECTTHPSCQEGPLSVAPASCCCPVPQPLQVPQPHQNRWPVGLEGRVTVSHWGQMQKPQESVIEGVFFFLIANIRPMYFPRYL